MRSTRAAAAVERLKQRSSNPKYSMALSSNGLFQLVLYNENNSPENVGEPLVLDDFVKFINNYGPQTPKRVSKLDVAFEKQLAQKPRK